MVGAGDVAGVVVVLGADVDHRVLGEVVVQVHGAEDAGAVAGVVDVVEHRIGDGLERLVRRGADLEGEVVGRRAGPLVGGQIVVEEAVAAEGQAVGVVAQHVQVGGDLAGVLPGPAVDHDGHVGGQHVQHLVVAQALVRRELVGAGDVARDAGGALAQVVLERVVVQDEVLVEVVHHVGVTDDLEALGQHPLDAVADHGGRILAQLGQRMLGELVVVVGGLRVGQQVVGVGGPAVQRAVPGGHAELQAVGVLVAHQLHGDLDVPGGLAGVAGDHVGLVAGNGAREVVQDGAERAVVGAGDVAGQVVLFPADVDDGVVAEVVVHGLGAEDAGAVGAVVDVRLAGLGHGLERGHPGIGGATVAVVVVVGATPEGGHRDHQEDQPGLAVLHSSLLLRPGGLVPVTTSRPPSGCLRVRALPP